MCRSKKILVIIPGLIVLIVLISLFTILRTGERPQEIVPEEALYRTHLDSLLANTGLTPVKKERDEFVYYELYGDCGESKGFVFLGEEEGYIGPIRLFVQTSPIGTIQKVYVWDHRETPVYVPSIKLGEFLETFVDYEVDRELKWQTDVHGLTGATGTVEAIIIGVRNLGLMAKEKEVF